MEITNKDAIIVVSTPRSGSSWMSRILRGHPDLNVYTHNTNNTQILYLLYPLRSFNPFGDDSVEKKSFSGGVLKKLRVKIVSSYYNNPSPDRKLVLASPTNVEFLPLLMEVFPGARYVHLKRDPLDAIASFKDFLDYNGKNGVKERFLKFKHQGYLPASRTALTHLFHSMRWLRVRHSGYVGTRPTGFQSMARSPILEFLCWYYFRLEEQIDEAISRVPPDRALTITYEGLVLDHEAEMRRLLEFMGVSVLEEHLLKTLSNIRTGGVGRYKKTFDQTELEEVKKHIAALTTGRSESNAILYQNV